MLTLGFFLLALSIPTQNKHRVLRSISLNFRITLPLSLHHFFGRILPVSLPSPRIRNFSIPLISRVPLLNFLLLGGRELRVCRKTSKIAHIGRVGYHVASIRQASLALELPGSTCFGLLVGAASDLQPVHDSPGNNHFFGRRGRVVRPAFVVFLGRSELAGLQVVLALEVVHQFRRLLDPRVEIRKLLALAQGLADADRLDTRLLLLLFEVLPGPRLHHPRAAQGNPLDYPAHRLGEANLGGLAAENLDLRLPPVLRALHHFPFLDVFADLVGVPRFFGVFFAFPRNQEVARGVREGYPQSHRLGDLRVFNGLRRL